MTAARPRPRATDEKPRSRRGRPSKQETARRGDARQLLLDAAHEAMIAKDSVDVSVMEIAERAGQSPAVVQYHFGGKDGLLRALMRRGTDRSVAQLTELAGLDMPADRKLAAHIRGLVNAYYQAPYVNALFRHLSDLAPEGETEAVFREFSQPIVRFYEKVLAQGVAEGLFRDVSVMHLYMLIVGASDHIFARRKSLPVLFGVETMDDVQRRSYSDFLTDMVLTSLRP
jgi:TetR/AcrR family transcriptional regulator